MKNTINFLALLLLFSCNTSYKEKKLNDSLNINFRILDYNSKEYLSKIYSPDIGSVLNGSAKIAKLSLINNGDNMIVITDDERTFVVNEWYENNKYSKAIFHFPIPGRRKIFLKQKDSTIIYLPYYLAHDSLMVNMHWQRDSVWVDKIVFFKNKNNQLQFLGTRKSLNNKEHYREAHPFSYCTIMDDSISRKLKQ
jgi:hypothetical protein